MTNYESRAQPGRFLMPHIMCPTTEDIISYILNWVCPECEDQSENVLKSSRVMSNGLA